MTPPRRLPVTWPAPFMKLCAATAWARVARNVVCSSSTKTAISKLPHAMPEKSCDVITHGQPRAQTN